MEELSFNRLVFVCLFVFSEYYEEKVPEIWASPEDVIAFLCNHSQIWLVLHSSPILRCDLLSTYYLIIVIL